MVAPEVASLIASNAASVIATVVASPISTIVESPNILFKHNHLTINQSPELPNKVKKPTSECNEEPFEFDCS